MEGRLEQQESSGLGVQDSESLRWKLFGSPASQPAPELVGGLRSPIFRNISPISLILRKDPLILQAHQNMGAKALTFERTM